MLPSARALEVDVMSASEEAAAEEAEGAAKNEEAEPDEAEDEHRSIEPALDVVEELPPFPVEGLVVV